MRIILFLVFCSGCSVHSEFTIRGNVNETQGVESKHAEAAYTLVMTR